MAQQEIFQLEPLFSDVQLLPVFADGKTFVDCIPKKNTQDILDDYLRERENAGFDLKEFVKTHFELPHQFAADIKSDAANSINAHINHLWDALTRQPDSAAGSLIPLPNPYIVPGGRFGEVYYWDSYFTMLGLKVSGKNELLENMLDNFAHLIRSIGFIPNGNRTYYLGRSQPPFFSLMVRLLASIKGKDVLLHYLPELEKEYQWWMNGKDELSIENNFWHHVVLLPDGAILNRYCDALNTPRPESYREDVELAHQSNQEPATLYKHLRAGAESGWDYSSRWFKDGKNFATLHTADLIPVDLNCLLFHLEQAIAEAYKLNGDLEKSNDYLTLSIKRKAAIEKYCWSTSLNFYVDFDAVTNQQKKELTLAGIAPLYFNIASQQQADFTSEKLQAHFLKPGGLQTTLKQTGQQWDAPNGWAPLQWMAVQGLKNYQQNDLAKIITQRWLQLNTAVFNRTGKMMEKYNVVDTELEAGGGEYAGQDGFGWTNAVFLALQQ